MRKGKRYDQSVLYTSVKLSKNKLKIKRQEKSVTIRRWLYTSQKVALFRHWLDYKTSQTLEPKYLLFSPHNF